ncbi:tRNA (adenosine(37)-N6)-dimethylallyltransferase MiaA [Candidatus Peregrinibacteria bacterium]|nr:tRNA (adenosine(37)-N6)-dimethylallyltransferase MiaA [Candidatus Peregrinibacteria bacterium]
MSINWNEILNPFLKKAKNPLIVILGPTASGKTALGLKIAHLTDGEIISADSRQVYREMNIGTDKIPQEKQENIPHHMLNIVNPDEPFTLADFKDRTEKIIEEIRERGHVPFLVGGTGLYISAVTENYLIPRVEPNKELREKLLEEAKNKPHDYLHKKLQEIDPDEAVKIHPHNLRYVIRALEINLSRNEAFAADYLHARREECFSEVPIVNQEKKTKKGHSRYDTFFIGIRWPREELYERVNMRVDQQLRGGLLAEVEKLLGKYDPRLPSMSSLGYKELVSFLKGECTYPEAVELIKKNTRNYAKRQMTWFRRNESILWIDGHKIV